VEMEVGFLTCFNRISIEIIEVAVGYGIQPVYRSAGMNMTALDYVFYNYCRGLESHWCSRGIQEVWEYTLFELTLVLSLLCPPPNMATLQEIALSEIVRNCYLDRLDLIHQFYLKMIKGNCL